SDTPGMNLPYCCVFGPEENVVRAAGPGHTEDSRMLCKGKVHLQDLGQVELSEKWGGRVEELVEELRKGECKAVLEPEVRELKENLMAKIENVARQLDGRFEEIDAMVKAGGEKREAEETELEGLKRKEGQMVCMQQCCPVNTVTLLRLREQGQGPRRPTHTLRFDKMAEDRAAHYELEETACKLPASVRSTFLMAFSPDCTKVASTHGDHRIHVCEVSTGKLAHTLEGHPRTPWCLAFHPTSNHILASGCLAGQVRVWDLRGGSEVWTSPQGTVISSLAFHPWEPLLAIASANRVVLWHWRKGRALATCKTASEREKVRFVQFSGGRSLVTGITNLDPSSLAGLSGALHLERPPLLGPRLEAPLAGGSSQRRSILTRLMSMYQHLEGLEELSTYQQPGPSLEPEEALQQARDYARDVTTYSTHLQRLRREGRQRWWEEGLLDEEEEPLPPSTNPAPRLSGGSSPHSRHFWATFYRLRSICSRLERRMQQHQRSTGATSRAGADLGADADGSAGQVGQCDVVRRDLNHACPVGRLMRSSAGTTSEGAGGEGGGPPGRGGSGGNPSGQEVSLSLVSLLTRLQLSLQSLSSAALTTAVAREQIHQVRMRITEILERLANVSGYRARLTSLRDQIYEAERMARREDEGSPSQHWDLAYCLWLV
ncbi:hypothetical protein IscW_ISCW011831, partial [Ixodes scapularis]